MVAQDSKAGPSEGEGGGVERFASRQILVTKSCQAYHKPTILKKIIIYLLLAALLLIPIVSFAQPDKDYLIDENYTELSDEQKGFTENEADFSQKTIKAKILEIIEEKTIKDENGQDQVLQKIRLFGEDKNEYTYDGILQNSTTKKKYERNDTVLLSITQNGNEEMIQITDSVRTSSLWLYLFIFILITVLIAKMKGFKAILSLGATIAIIIWAVIPLIASGLNPLFTVILFSIPILAIAIYLTHGFNKESHIALAGTFFGVLAVGLISLIFAKMSHLSGFADEETIYIAGLLKEKFNPYSLLLAGFVIGALGVIDDVALTQVAAVSEIKKANPRLKPRSVYNAAMKIGVSHVASVINTLFLAYAGASFSLLLLFNYRQPPFENSFMILNNEIVATEIIRTIVGSIGILLVIPIVTALASKYILINEKNS